MPDLNEPLDRLLDLPLGRHLCHFYQTPQDLLDTLVPFFAEGIKRGHMCLWITSEHVDLDAARSAMCHAVPDMEQRLNRGQMEFFDYRDWYTPDGSFDLDRVLARAVEKEQQMTERGFDGLRTGGDTAWAVGVAWDDFMLYESKLARTLADHRIAATCSYHLDRCRSHELIDAVRTHDVAFVRRQGQWQMLENPAIGEAYQRLRTANGKLQNLAHQLTTAEQKERRRVAHVLHEGIQQVLAAAQMSLLQARTPGSDIDWALDRTHNLIAQSIDHCRTLSVELSPPVLYVVGLGAALQWLAKQFEQLHGLTVAVSVPAGEPPLPEPIKTFFFETTRELLFNAVKHAGVDAAEIEFASPAGAWSLTVRDHGKGFLSNEASEAEGGHMGLFSLRQRLSLLGGKLEVRSAIGQGCAVTVTLPVTDPPASSQETAGEGQGPAVRVLLVDDHHAVRQGLAMVLRKHQGIHIIGEAYDGVDAVEQARTLKPDVIVMDITMPRLSGILATRQIVRDHPHIRVLGMSIHDRPELAQEMLSAGAERYFQKYAPIQQLVDAILAPSPSVC